MAATPLHSGQLVLAALITLVPRLASAQASSEIENNTAPQEFMFGAAIGPSFSKGSRGFSDISDAGGAASFRVGTAASQRLLFVFQLDVASFPTDDPDSDKTIVNAHSLLTIGAQYYLRRAIWAKAGFGIANKTEREQGSALNNLLSTGAAFMVSGGVDLYRRKRFAVSFELLWGLGIHNRNAIFQTSGLLGLSWY